MFNTQSSAAANKLSQDQLLLRINGILPDIATLGSIEKSERAAEVKRLGTSTNTSCSLFAMARETNQIFHILVDIGQGIVKSIEKGIIDLGFASSSILPDALLVTHSHDDHIVELPLLADKTSKSKNLNIYCTSQCRDQILSKYPQLSSKINTNNELVFSIVQPDQTFQVGPFSVIPLLADHGDNSPAGSVIYIVKLTNRKVIIGWDFLSLPNVNEDLLWNPDLAILGTQSYNPHPQTGMISVSEAFELVRRWNAEECYIVHYRGLLDFEEATNQWFRGPVKAMTVDELQKVIDSHLQIVGKGGKFRMTVAKEGMVWDSKRLETKQEEEEEKVQESSPQNASISSQFIEIEGLQNYIVRMEKEHKVDKLKIMIEDRINRYNLEFDKPRKVVNVGDDNKDVLVAQGVKGMLAKGPDLRMEITPKTENEYVINVRASKGKKNVFNDDILVNSTDAQRLKRYINENFMPNPKDAK